MSEPTDEELMLRYQGGDRAAFRVIFERYSRRLFGLMRQRIYNPADAQELVQQTFMQFHRARADFRPGAKVKPWLMTIALNLRRDHCRRLGNRTPMVSLDEAPEKGAEHRDAERKDEAAQVRRAVAQLPEKMRSVVELHWFAEMSYAEISQVLGISQSAAKVRAHRAYESLRTTLGKEL